MKLLFPENTVTPFELAGTPVMVMLLEADSVMLPLSTSNPVVLAFELVMVRFSSSTIPAEITSVAVAKADFESTAPRPPLLKVIVFPVPDWRV